MIADLELIKRTFQIQYAPFDWKREHLKWDIDLEFTKIVNRINDKPSITTKEFQQLVKQFLGSTQDYHVDITFYSTESSSLPFSIKTVDGKSLINWVDWMNLPSGEDQIEIGDELIEFDEFPVQEVLAEIMVSKGKLANTATDRALADSNLTFRFGKFGDMIKKGPILIKTQSRKGGSIKIHHMQWNYQPEKIGSPFDFSCLAGQLLTLGLEKKISPEELLNSIQKKQRMICPAHQERIETLNLRQGEIGAHKSFLPLLGFPIWKYDLNEGNRVNWFSYIYKNDNDKSIGYIRIPHYSGENEDVFNFLSIIGYLEKHTDALIIDQLNNPGGDAPFMYQLLSLLSPFPMLTPRHQIAINQQQIMEAVKAIDDLELYLSFNDPNSIGSQMDSIQQLKQYYRFVIEEWNNGEVLTHPTHLRGVEYIRPHPIVQYTKPILMLINELDFSAGDFAPAILQDNHRAVLMGSRTAGAGGAVTTFTFPNRYGIKEISYTDTIAERYNLVKIENLGVMPDIEYKITEDDIQTGYRNYRSAINQVIDQLALKTCNKSSA